MAVNVVCPGCRTSHPVAEDLLGKKIRCKKCQETFTAAATRNGEARTADERIQTRPAAARDNGAADGPPRANPKSGIRPAKAGGMTQKTMIIIAASAGGLVAAMGGITLWALRHDVGIRVVEPVANALALRSNEARSREELAAVFGLMQGVIAHVAPLLSSDLERSNPERPWRILHANFAITAEK